ncbi:MAG: hypothetical protein QXT13_12115 [Pyrobaculum sp.]
MIIFSVPPVDGIVITPGLKRYVTVDMLSMAFALLDIGIAGARNDMAHKARRAYEFYMSLLSELAGVDTPPSHVFLVVPDAFDAKQHLRLAEVFRIYQRKIETAWTGVFKLRFLLVVRRFLRRETLDAETFGKLSHYADHYRGVAIPANVDTAGERDVKCARELDTCLRHINRALDLFATAEWRHLLGPPLRSVLSRYLRDVRVDSADTTSHRLDLISRFGTRDASLLHFTVSFVGYLSKSRRRVFPAISTSV